MRPQNIHELANQFLTSGLSEMRSPTLEESPAMLSPANNLDLSALGGFSSKNINIRAFEVILDDESQGLRKERNIRTKGKCILFFLSDF